MSIKSINSMLIIMALCLAVGCSPIPKKYLRNAEPGVTLTSLQGTSSYYEGKLVILGGTIVEEEVRGGQLWFHVVNRPLDRDYRPQLPPSPNDPEGGFYWVVVGNRMNFPDSYRHWGDMLVVGRVIALVPGKEPVLQMVYVRGRGSQAEHDAAWEDAVAANYILSSPAGALNDMGRR
ncbi:MAG TPA: Slp family lipoprotein [Nitrospiraceae bacterium]|nr:Slp family lipoprotein [Nitrospiraceae bacterium]